MSKMKELVSKINEIIEEEHLTEEEKFELFSEIFSLNISLSSFKEKGEKFMSENKENYSLQNKIIGIPLEAVLVFLGEQDVQSS